MEHGAVIPCRAVHPLILSRDQFIVQTKPTAVGVGDLFACQASFQHVVIGMNGGQRSSKRLLANLLRVRIVAVSIDYRVFMQA